MKSFLLAAFLLFSCLGFSDITSSETWPHLNCADPVLEVQKLDRRVLAVFQKNDQVDDLELLRMFLKGAYICAFSKKKEDFYSYMTLAMFWTCSRNGWKDSPDQPPDFADCMQKKTGVCPNQKRK